jgi:hypothetical protein
MHTYKKDGVVFNYNSDFSGDISVKSYGKEVKIPCGVLLDFISECYIKPNKIEEIESMDYKEILNKI